MLTVLLRRFSPKPTRNVRSKPKPRVINIIIVYYSITVRRTYARYKSTLPLSAADRKKKKYKTRSVRSATADRAAVFTGSARVSLLSMEHINHIYANMNWGLYRRFRRCPQNVLRIQKHELIDAMLDFCVVISKTFTEATTIFEG